MRVVVSDTRPSRSEARWTASRINGCQRWGVDTVDKTGLSTMQRADGSGMNGRMPGNWNGANAGPVFRDRFKRKPKPNKAQGKASVSDEEWKEFQNQPRSERRWSRVHKRGGEDKGGTGSIRGHRECGGKKDKRARQAKSDWKGDPRGVDRVTGYLTPSVNARQSVRDDEESRQRDQADRERERE